MITSHAVENYQDRVLNIRERQAGISIEEFIEEQIKLAVNSPNIVYRDGDNETPIHIRNGCAAPVKKENGRVYVPTVYEASTFTEKISNYEQ